MTNKNTTLKAEKKSFPLFYTMLRNLLKPLKLKLL